MRKLTEQRTEKRCCVCREILPIELFYKQNTSSDGHLYCCRNCQKIRSKIHHSTYRAKNKDTERYKTRHRKSNLRQFHNISLEEYNEMFVAQNGCCAICGKHQIKFTRRLGVDHDHKTGKIRGLLCDCCNRGMGFMSDDAEICLKAYQYLRKS